MLHFLRRSTPLFMLLALGIAWGGCAKRIASMQAVNIPDANLRAVIERALDKPAGAIITNAEMATLTNLEGGRVNIRDLTGLEFAINLTELHLRSNQLSDLSPLAGLTKLKWLNISESGVTDLSPLAGLKNLEDLDISDNQLSDLSPLAGLTNLEFLSINESGILDPSQD